MDDEGTGAEELERYREACARWFGWLDDDGEHSITDQLSRLFWQDAVFRIFNEARRHAAKTGPAAAIGPTLARFLDEGYVAGQVVGISKLLEISRESQPKKGVISLRRLVDDLIANRHLLTRANYLGRDGLPYDYEAIQAEEYARLLERADPQNPTFEWMEVGGARDWDTAQRLHEQFDRLAGVKPENRNPDDLVSEETLGRLLAAFDDPVFKTITTVRHKSVAHAADDYSRQQAAEYRTGIKFDEIDRALWVLVGVKQAISATLLHGPWRAGAVPVPQRDHFLHLDKPFIDPAAVDELRAFWDQHAEARDQWLTDSYEEFLPPKR